MALPIDRKYYYFLCRSVARRIAFDRMKKNIITS